MDFYLYLDQENFGWSILKYSKSLNWNWWIKLKLWALADIDVNNTYASVCACACKHSTHICSCTQTFGPGSCPHPFFCFSPDLAFVLLLTLEYSLFPSRCLLPVIFACLNSLPYARTTCDLAASLAFTYKAHSLLIWEPNSFQSLPKVPCCDI